MKNLYLFLFLLVATSSFAQLSVRPTTGDSGSDNYMYIKGTVLYVNDDIDLTRNSDTDIASIYLREDGQIVQGRTDASQNSGNGSISVYQEGTTYAYDYNYWSSPVSNQGSGSIDGNRQFSVASLSAPLTTLTSNPVTMTTANNGFSANGGILNIARYWIWKYVSTGSNDYADWVHVQESQTINAGEGFTMKGVNGSDNTEVNGVLNNSGANQRYDFRGRPNDGLITVPTTSIGETILVGNPYPSAFNLNYFLLENSAVFDEEGNLVPSNVNPDCTGGEIVSRKDATTGIAYFWSSDPSVQSHNISDYVGGYSSYSPDGNCTSDGVFTPPTYYNYTGSGVPVDGSGAEQTGVTEFRRFLAIGQGFVVRANNTLDGSDNYAGVDIQFKNTHRLYMEEGTANNSVFGRNSSQNTAASTNNDLNSENVVPKIRFNIAFDDDYTRQIALAFDDEATTGVDVARDAFNINSVASDAGFKLNNKNYTIDIRPFDENDHIPLYIKLLEQKDLAIKVHSFENFDTDEVYLHDLENDTYHSIKNDTYYVTLPIGYHLNKFEITFKNNENLSIGKDIAESFDIFQNNSSQLLEVANPMGVDLKSVTVYDMTGKQVIQKANLGTNDRYTFSTANLAASVYVVKILTQDNVVSTKKISVLNRG
ncbi:T9SS type A sorting domain-containing protein [Mesonia mobilis]|uniref:T9SS type A sorting domain-containing protein n=1 Tax=Mesonia mobilis TaxID=369791 RepID=UPI0026F1422C|nr:T9SS type A sorting domain-containing protein [Mesonia mobilis]